ncbi:MAG: hypothetical protein ABIJ48_01995 [Actinomycetota bacterium]
MPGIPVDTLGRPARDLRVSVTHRCSFCCRCCLPRVVFGTDHRFLPRTDLPRFKEITRLASILSGLGVAQGAFHRGASPQLRHDLERPVALLAAVPTSKNSP